MFDLFFFLSQRAKHVAFTHEEPSALCYLRCLQKRPHRTSKNRFQKSCTNTSWLNEFNKCLSFHSFCFTQLFSLSSFHSEGFFASMGHISLNPVVIMAQTCTETFICITQIFLLFHPSFLFLLWVNYKVLLKLINTKLYIYIKKIFLSLLTTLIIFYAYESPLAK